MTYSVAVMMSISAGSVRVLQTEVEGKKMAADVAGGDGEWEPSVNIISWCW